MEAGGQRPIDSERGAHRQEIQALAETDCYRQTAAGVRGAAALRNETDGLLQRPSGIVNAKLHR